MPLSFENGYEMFENLQNNQSRFQCDDGGLNALLMENKTCVAESITHTESATAIEVLF